MDALTDNALANMPGPYFLAFFACLAVSAVAGVIFAAAAAPTEGRPLPAIPARPDPYPIAFLRDGYGGVVWLAIYALKRGGFLEIAANGKLRPAPHEGRPSHPCEARVLRAIGHGCAASAIVAG